MTSKEILGALEVFRNSRPERKAEDVLESIVLSAATLGFTMFSQKDPTTIEWPLDEEDRIVVFPALQRIMRSLDGQKTNTIQITAAKTA